MSKSMEWGSLPVPAVLAAAHELKSPLVLIRQLSYQLEATGPLTVEQAIVQQRLRLTSERALRLVENITTSSRLKDSLFALEPLHAKAVWHGVAEEMTPLAAHMSQRLEISVPSRPLLAVGHKELLSAVLIGLCDNALAHNPAGDIVSLSALERRGKVVFSVRDRGPVIGHSQFKALESQLGHSPQPLGARPGSSGLGLWVAGSFARAMSSELTVTRHRLGGMTFSLHVPTSGQLALL